MVKTFIGIWLLLCAFCLSATDTQALPPPDRTRMDGAAQDGSGTVWGLSSYDGNNDGTICRWESGAWAIKALPGAAGFRLLLLTRGDDGSVYGLWQRRNQAPSQTLVCLVTVHRDSDSRILAHLAEPVVRDVGGVGTPGLWAGREGDIWIAGYQSLLQHLAPDGSLQTFPLKPAQYFGEKFPNDYSSPQIDSMLDRSGRRWFWQKQTYGGWPQSGLRGILIWDGKTLAYHATLPGAPDRPFSFLASLDANHVWLSTAGDDYSHWPVTHGALYRVDTRTLTTVPETPPQPGAFENVAQVFLIDGIWYLRDALGQGSPFAILWRERKGHWQKCPDQTGPASFYRSDWRNSRLVEPAGVWLGADGGAWWLPRNSKPAIWVNWRRGLGVGSVSDLFPLADGSILAFGSGGTMQMPPMPPPLLPKRIGVVIDGMGAPKSLGLLLSDSRNHLWGTPTSYAGTCPLAEWDGRRWRTHLPPESIPGVGSLYGSDSFGRLWMTTSNWNPKTQPQPVEGRAVYDPAADTWTWYETVPDALQAAASRPSMAFLPCRNNPDPPLFSRDGRVIYNNGTAIFLYDGSTWRHWQSGDILTNYGGNVPDYLNFNQEGHLELTLGYQICEWTPENGWLKTGQRGYVPFPDPVPPGGPHGLWVYPAIDSLGRKWFAWKGGIYTAWHGLWVKQAELSGPGSPFWDGHNLTDVLCDPAGRLFFDTFVVWSPPSVPRPTVSVVPTSADSVVLHFTSKVHGPHWFLWRLNGSDWSAPQTNASAILASLPHGSYRIEAQTLDSHLQISDPPAAATFVVRIDSGAQIANWVQALLTGTDDAREAAVAGLVKQPAESRAALQAARPSASESARWWIDAALQQITEHNSGTE